MDFTHPHFAEPRWLWLAILGPGLLFVLFRYAARARRHQIAQLAAPELLVRLLPSFSHLKRALKHSLLLLAVAVMGLALARPQWGEQPEASQALGEDILFLVDCSRSMLAADVRPNRLTRAKLAIMDFVQRHGRGRLGLLAFAGQAFLQCPLTFDYDAFRESLMSIDEQTMPVPGTDIGRALDEAYMAMEKNDRRKMMVLVTDGEDLEKSGIKQAKQLAEKGVVVYTIGVGTPAGTPIQVMNERGQVDTLRDRSGQVVESRLDESTLQSIAQATHGKYYPLGPLGEGMDRLRRVVETTQTGPGNLQLRKFGVDRFHVMVAFILFLLVTESLIGTRRHLGEVRYEQIPWNNLNREKSIFSYPQLKQGKEMLLGLLLLPVATLSVSAEAASSLSNDAPPLTTPRDFYNDGTLKLHGGKLREAEASLQAAVASNDERVQPLALYNLGQVRFKEGAETLKEIDSGKGAHARSQTATAMADQAIQVADAALAGDDLGAILRAYMNGRGARKELKNAQEAVKRALEIYGTVLQRWQRASGDFKSAYELRPKDENARFNANVVDQQIAALVDRQQMMQMAAKQAGGKTQELRQRMQELKKRLPDGMIPKNGDEDDDEEEQPKEPKSGQKELPPKEGREMALTPEEALRLLESLQLDANRKLPMGEERTAQPKDRKGRDW